LGFITEDCKPSDHWSQQIHGIDWSKYHTSYGAATDVPGQLERLRSADEQAASSAAHELCCGLCRQHVQIASAALPFLLGVFATAGDRLKVETLDLLLGFAFTTDLLRIEQFARAMGEMSSDPRGWIGEVRSVLVTAFATDSATERSRRSRYCRLRAANRRRTPTRCAITRTTVDGRRTPLTNLRNGRPRVLPSTESPTTSGQAGASGAITPGLTKVAANLLVYDLCPQITNQGFVSSNSYWLGFTP